MGSRNLNFLYLGALLVCCQLHLVTLHASEVIDVRVDLDVEGSATESGWQTMDARAGSTLTLGEQSFELFGYERTNTRDRNGPGAVTRDFAFNDGSKAAIGLRIQGLPEGQYILESWHFDTRAVGTVRVELRKPGGKARVLASGHSIKNTGPATVEFGSDGGVYEVIFREDDDSNRSRLNGFRLRRAESEEGAVTQGRAVGAATDTESEPGAGHIDGEKIAKTDTNNQDETAQKNKTYGEVLESYLDGTLTQNAAPPSSGSSSAISVSRASSSSSSGPIRKGLPPLNLNKSLEVAPYFTDIKEYARLIEEEDSQAVVKLAEFKSKANQTSDTERFIWQSLLGQAYVHTGKRDLGGELISKALCASGAFDSSKQLSCSTTDPRLAIQDLSIFEYKLLVSNLSKYSCLRINDNQVVESVAINDQIAQLIRNIVEHSEVKSNPKIVSNSSSLLDGYLGDTCLGRFSDDDVNLFAMMSQMMVQQGTLTFLNAVEKARGMEMALNDFTSSEFLQSFRNQKLDSIELKKQLAGIRLESDLFYKLAEHITGNELEAVKVGVTVRNSVIDGRASAEQLQAFLALKGLPDGDKIVNADSEIRAHWHYAQRMVEQRRNAEAIASLRKAITFFDTYEVKDEVSDLLHWTRPVAMLGKLLGDGPEAREEVDQAIELIQKGHSRYASLVKDFLNYDPKTEAIHTDMMSRMFRAGAAINSARGRLRVHDDHRLFELGMAELYLALDDKSKAQRWLNGKEKTSKRQTGHVFAAPVRAFEASTYARYYQAIGKYEEATNQYRLAVDTWYANPAALFDGVHGVFSHRTQILDEAAKFEVKHGSKARALDYVELSRLASVDNTNLFAHVDDAYLRKQHKKMNELFDKILVAAEKTAEEKGQPNKFYDASRRAEFDYWGVSYGTNASGVRAAGPNLDKILNELLPWLDFSLAQQAVEQYFIIDNHAMLVDLENIRTKALKEEYEYYLSSLDEPAATDDLEAVTQGDAGELLPQVTLASGHELLNADAIAKQLQPDESMLSLWLTREDLFVFAVNNEGISANVIPRDEIDALIDVVAERYTPYAAKALYRALIMPVEQQLRKRVAIASNGRLQHLPFAALANNNEAFLGDEHLLRFLPTLNHGFTSASNNAGSDILVMAPTNVPGEQLLTGAADEAEAIQASFNAALAMDEKVTKAYFLSEAPKYNVIHYAGHGALNPEFPDYSKLIVHGSNKSRSAIFVEEIERMDLSKVQLAVLSACETGITRSHDLNNEFSSLSSAFLDAGADSVVSSIAVVDDGATKALMLEFYNRLASGDAKDVALQKAQRRVREMGYDNPSDWATFGLWGNVAKLTVASP